MPATDAAHPWDVLGEPWTAETISLADDDEGEVVATLVTRRPAGPENEPPVGAVLHVHGFSDYFFDVAHADWWAARGYTFYALDLRKYGRSIRPHQTPTWVTDLGEYDADLDAAWQRITARDGHRRVVVSGHSTGGLVTSLWAHDRRPAELAGLVLNSPWLDLQGKAWLRSLPAGVLLDQVGRRQPRRVLIPAAPGFYAQSLHREHVGEFDFDLTWKPLASFPVRAGWLRAIRRGHARVHAGLDVAAPVLVLASDDSFNAHEMSERVHAADIVLDVRHMRRWATAIGRHVTFTTVPGARHEVFLSRRPARDRAYDELGRWLSAYLDESDVDHPVRPTADTERGH